MYAKIIIDEAILWFDIEVWEEQNKLKKDDIIFCLESSKNIENYIQILCKFGFGYICKYHIKEI